MVVGALFCLGMGLWQLARYQSVSGNVQNLGYTFMWPFLAGFLVYAYLKYIRLEADAEAEAEAGAEPEDVSAAPRADGGAGGRGDHGDDDERAAAPRDRTRRRRPGSTPTEIPSDILPTRRPAAAAEPEDEGLRAYNAYLADLDRRDRRSGDRPADRPQENPAP